MENTHQNTEIFMRNDPTAQKVTNTSAESGIDTIANVVKTIGIILSVVILIIGIVISVNMERGLPFFISIIVAILFYLPIYIQWALLKININISRNLFVIKDIFLFQTGNAYKQDQPEVQEQENKKEDRKVEGIIKLQELREAGLISQEEFEEQISKL